MTVERSIADTTLISSSTCCDCNILATAPLIQVKTCDVRQRFAPFAQEIATTLEEQVDQRSLVVHIGAMDVNLYHRRRRQRDFPRRHSPGRRQRALAGRLATWGRPAGRRYGAGAGAARGQPWRRVDDP